MKASERRWWNERKILWYERASSLSSFHRSLCQELQQYLKNDETIMEYGCGLGHTAEILSRDGYSIKASDIDSEVIVRAKSRSGLNIYSSFDYREDKNVYDTVLTLFFGRLWVDDNLSFFMEKARNRLVSVHSLHSGQNSALVSRHTPSLSESLEFIKEKGFKAEGKEIVIPFPQYLKSRDEAIAFIKESYPGKNPEEYLPYLKASDNKDYPLILENNKRMVILSISR